MLQTVELRRRVLDALNSENKRVTTMTLSTELDENHTTVVGECKSLESLGLIELEAESLVQYNLLPEGVCYLSAGTPEAKVWGFVVKNQPTSLDEVRHHLDEKTVSIGLSQGMKKKLLSFDAEKRLITKVQTFEDETQQLLQTIQNKLPVLQSQATDLKKRQLIEINRIAVYVVSPGRHFGVELSLFTDDLTSEMLRTGTWKNSIFKPANFDCYGKRPYLGSMHALSNAISKFSSVFQELGFEEMPTNQWVESSFWNFDSLFQPQQHPSRDAHDTFFLKDPINSDLSHIPETYLEEVKKTHIDGGCTGSIGYRSSWSAEEAAKNILRTHTTAVTAQMLFKLSKEIKKNGYVEPRKFFSIDRVFRNETLDATHLAEFHQVEGLVADKNISMSRLMDVLTSFYEKIGMEDLKFKPTYNPYTEPSLEIYGFHAGLQKWLEVGNSGIFRPEMLLPMGIPADIGVMAWGLSLERPTMICHEIQNIRDLFGSRAAIGTKVF